MKHLLAALALLTSCSTIPRPDLPTVKQGGKVYEQYQSTLLGIPLGKPKRRVVPSKLDETQVVLRAPAKWTLWVALPLALLAGAACLVAVVYLQDMKRAKKYAVAASVLFSAALGATAWLIATTWMWVFALLLGLLIITSVAAVYYLTKGKTLCLSSG